MDEFFTRSVPFTLERASEDGDGLTLTGYAAVFDSATRIDSREGRFDETIKRGAFTKTLRERKPVLQFDHGQHPAIGSIPIGEIKTLREDDRGLYVEARLFDNDLVLPVRQAIAAQAITGMSFRFQVVKDVWDDSGDVSKRTLTEVRLHELGPVVFPAYEATSVGVRSSVVEQVNAMTDEQVSELLRAVVLRTPRTEAGSTTSEQEPLPDTSEPPARHSGATRTARALAFAEHGI